MGAGIIPLRGKNETHSALARVDVIAAARLTSGQAVNLQVARAEVILAELWGHRCQLADLLADLQRQKSSDNADIDQANAKLVTATTLGLVQIDLFIAQAQAFVEQDLRPKANLPGSPG
jgi:antitoxin component of MazEF toxin-antitoxin module